jgi:CRP-like cAMP-binding protein
MKSITENDLEFFCDIQAPCFQLLSKEEMEIIKSSKTQIAFRKGDNLTKQGAFIGYILFLVKGIVKQYIEGPDGKSFNLRLLRPGHFVGLSSMYSQNVYQYSSMAIHESQAILIDSKTMINIAQKNSLFAYNISKRFHMQNDSFYEIMQKTMFKQMPGKLADTLLYLSSDFFESVDIFPMLTRKDLAEFAGMSTESTVKILKSFEIDGIIELKDKQIIIKNKAKLQEISNLG